MSVKKAQQFLDDVQHYSGSKPPASEYEKHLRAVLKHLQYVRDNTMVIAEHDDNGPGQFRCPICHVSVDMKWQRGTLLNGEMNDINHNAECPLC